MLNMFFLYFSFLCSWLAKVFCSLCCCLVRWLNHLAAPNSLFFTPLRFFFFHYYYFSILNNFCASFCGFKKYLLLIHFFFKIIYLKKQKLWKVIYYYCSQTINGQSCWSDYIYRGWKDIRCWFPWWIDVQKGGSLSTIC